MKLCFKKNSNSNGTLLLSLNKVNELMLFIFVEPLQTFKKFVRIFHIIYYHIKVLYSISRYSKY